MKYQFIRRGHCKRCGQCCDKSLSQPQFWEKAERTDDPDVRIFEGVKGEKIRVHRLCNSLLFENGLAKCAKYQDRPKVCRNFPVNPCDLVIIPDCGYWFEVRCVE